MSKRLGKGLDALIPQLEADEKDKVVEISINELRPNPYQPRKQFEPEAIEELKKSILEHGVIQPIIVRKSIRGYEIIAGERRFRASKEAKLKTVPAVIRTFTESEVMEIALIENIQREDLNTLEVAIAYQKLMEKFELTQEQLAQKVGKSRPHITNYLRLLQLPDNVQEYVSRGTLSMGHARALLGVSDKKALVVLAKRCMEEELSVRHLEMLVNEIEEDNVSRETKRARKEKKSKNIFITELEGKLKDVLGTSVKIKKGDKKGKIEIDFTNDEDLDRIIQLMNH